MKTYKTNYVVYLLIPTSNHNFGGRITLDSSLYIFWFLHQTTTHRSRHKCTFRCISFDSYIKPQLQSVRCNEVNSCISFDSYIKPQLFIPAAKIDVSCISFDSYIKPQRIVMSLRSSGRCISFDSYIKPQPCAEWYNGAAGCISFDSYIKPQPLGDRHGCISVVYLLIPTSNHNLGKLQSLPK